MDLSGVSVQVYVYTLLYVLCMHASSIASAASMLVCVRWCRLHGR